MAARTNAKPAQEPRAKINWSVLGNKCVTLE
jgi:hypothetical protein